MSKNAEFLKKEEQVLQNLFNAVAIGDVKTTEALVKEIRENGYDINRPVNDIGLGIKQPVAFALNMASFEPSQLNAKEKSLYQKKKSILPVIEQMSKQRKKEYFDNKVAVADIISQIPGFNINVQVTMPDGKKNLDGLHITELPSHKRGFTDLFDGAWMLKLMGADKTRGVQRDKDTGELFDPKPYLEKYLQLSQDEKADTDLRSFISQKRQEEANSAVLKAKDKGETLMEMAIHTSYAGYFLSDSAKKGLMATVSNKVGKHFYNKLETLDKRYLEIIDQLSGALDQDKVVKRKSIQYHRVGGYSKVIEEIIKNAATESGSHVDRVEQGTRNRSKSMVVM